MYMHMIDKDSRMIVTIPDVLKVIDDKYDYLKNYYAGFAIENVLVRSRSDSTSIALFHRVFPFLLVCTRFTRRHFDLRHFNIWSVIQPKNTNQ